MAYTAIPLISIDQEHVNDLSEALARSPVVQQKLTEAIGSIYTAYQTVTEQIEACNKAKEIKAKECKTLIDSIEAIRQKANAFFDFKSQSPSLANSIRRLILSALDEQQELIIASREDLAVVLQGQEQILSSQQAILKNEQIKQCLEQLQELNPQALHAVHLCHVERLNQNEKWLHTLITKLYPHVKLAYRRIKWEEQDCGPGQNWYSYSKEFEYSKMIFFISPSFKTELAKVVVEEKLGTSVLIGLKKEPQDILPLIIGTPLSSMPPKCAEKWQASAETLTSNYLTLLKSILNFAYQETLAQDPKKKAQFEAIWTQIENLAAGKSKQSSFTNSFFNAPAPNHQGLTEEELKKAAYIETRLSKDELALIGLERLMGLPALELRAFCDTTLSFRNKGPIQNAECLFLSSVNALLNRGVNFVQFLGFSKEKQIALATNKHSWLMLNNGIDYQRICQLELDDLKQVHQLAAKQTTVNQKLNQEQLKELNDFIDEKLYLPSFTL